MSERKSIIEVRGLKTAFGPHVVHDGLNLDVWQSEVLGIVGGSGTGKSVLLRTILGLNKATEGSISLFGHTLDMTHGGIEDVPEGTLEKRTGVLFQDGALFSSLTVAENIEVPLKQHLNIAPALRREIAELKIALVGLPADAADKYPSELSGGMRKRAGLARALALDPEIVFLDEPTAGLDPIGAAAFDTLIRSLKDALGLTVFMVTHDLDTLHAICDRIAVLAEKRVIVEGDMAAMMAFDHPWVQEYFKGPRARAAEATNISGSE